MNRSILIELLKNKALSGTEIYSFLKSRGAKVKILRLRDIDQDDITTPLIVLLPSKKANDPIGHWISIFRTSTGIEYFDSYSLPPTDNKILALLYKWSMKHPKAIIEYNHHPFQKKGEKISTCGRWAMMRVILRDLSLKDFADTFGIHADDLVTRLTLEA